MCFTHVKDDLHISKRNLEYATKYEARVRSIPKTGYFDGFWSPWSAISKFQTEKDDVYDTSILPVALSISIPFFFLILVILVAVFWSSRIKPFVWPEIPDHKKTLEKFRHKPKQNHHISFNPNYYEIIPINKIDYMKAQEIPEDNHEISIADISAEKRSANGCNTSQCPVEGSTESGTDANNTGPCKNPADNEENTSDLIPGTTAPGDGDSEKSNASDNSSGIMSVAVKHPGNGIKGLCWEDIYIAMSAFKTPSSAAKQVPKNTL
ncbi:interleukin-7 receptor subunit alpha [Leptodactylus fuscus]